MAHLHSVYDSDMHFSIDPITRVIRNESSKTKLVQYDHNSERFTFELSNRFVEDHNMSLCDKVEIHFINIEANRSMETPRKSEDVYVVDDLQISPDDDSVVIFSWLISGNATKHAGSLNFLIRFVCIAEDGGVDYAWHTEIFTGISVSDGMNNGEAVVAEYSDVLEAWKREIFAEFQINFDNESAAQIAAIEAKGAEVLASIPDTYTDMTRQVAQNESDIADNDDRISRNDKRITNLEQGLMADAFETDASVAYVKDVPANALPYAAIGKIGGMTRKCTNLFDTAALGSTNISAVTNSDGTVTLTNKTASVITAVKTLTGTLTEGTYTFNNALGSTIYLQKSDSDYTNQLLVGQTKTFTYDGTSYLRVVMADFTANEARICKIMLNPGDTALPYEPYFEGLRSAKVESVESVGVNIFGGDALADEFVETVGATKDAATKTITFLASAIHGKRFYSDYKPNTAYTFMIYGKRSNNARTGLGIRYTDGNNDWLSFQRVNDESYCVFTSDANRTVSFLFGYDEDGGTCTFNYDKCGVFEGVLTAEDFKPYVKHTLPIPEAVRSKPWYGLGISKEVCNAIRYNEDGSRSGDVRCVKKVFDGTENFVAWANGSTFLGLMLDGVNYDYSNGMDLRGICSHYDVGVGGTFGINSVRFRQQGDVARWYFYDGTLTSVEAWKNRLAELYAAGNPLTVVYKLATPTTEDISDILPADNILPVQAGGTATAVNEHKYDVPWEITYQMKGVSE